MSGNPARSAGRQAKHPHKSLRRAEWLALLVIFGLATALRIAYALSSRQSPLFDQLDLDSRFYDLWAKRIAGGDWIGDEVFFMGPLYPYFLAVIYAIAGPNLLLVKIIQSVIGGLTAVFTFLLGRECFNSTVGLIAGCFVAFYVPFIFYDNSILFPVLAALLNTVMLYMLCRGVSRRERMAFLVAGIFCGLSAAGNASVLAYTPFVAAFLLLRGKGVIATRVAHVLVFALGIAMVVMPITIRNYVVGRDFVPLTSNAGLNLFIGNNPRSTGAYVKPESLDVYTDPSGRTIAEAATGRRLKPSEVSAYWMDRAMQFVRARPRQFLMNLARKFFFFWSVYEIPQIEHLQFEKRFSAILRIPSPSFGIICPLGIFGISIALRRNSISWLPFLFILVYSCTIVAFFVVARYRLPMIPALMGFAALGVYHVATELESWRYLLKSSAILIALFLLVHINFFGVDPLSGYAQSYYRVGLAYEKKGDYAAAMASYEKATELDPSLKGAYLNLGILLSRQGRYEQAKYQVMKAIGADSSYAKAYYDLGLIYAEQAQADSALAMFDRALRLDPDYDLAALAKASVLYEMAKLDSAGMILSRLSRESDLEPQSLRQLSSLLKLIPQRKAWLESRDLDYERASDRFLLRGDNLLAIGLVERARRAYARAVEIDRRSSLAYFQLGSIEMQMGRLKQAENFFRLAAESDPEFRGAHLALGAIAARRGDFKMACREFESELERDPASAQAHINLAMCYEQRLKDLDKAAYHLRRYIEIAGGTQELKQHLKDLEARLGNE